MHVDPSGEPHFKPVDEEESEREREEGGEGASISSALDVPLKIKEKAIARPPTYTAVSADERDGRVSGLWTLSWDCRGSDFECSNNIVNDRVLWAECFLHINLKKYI